MKKNIVIVILILVVGALSYYSYKQFNANKDLENKLNQSTKQDNTNASENSNQEQNNNQNTFDEEKELTDVYVKRDISKKTSIMLTEGGNNKEEDLIDTYSVDRIINLTDKEKLGIILSSSNSFRKLYPSEAKDKVPSLLDHALLSNGEIDGATNPSFTEASIIEKEYMEMFNTEPIKPIGKEQYGLRCPFYLYDSVTDIFMSTEECGGTAYPDYYFYKYKYTTKGDNIYVYVASTVVSFMEKKVYKGIKQEDAQYLYTATSDEQVTNDLKSNPEKYGLYKLTFEKNVKGIYYYKTTEKIN